MLDLAAGVVDELQQSPLGAGDGDQQTRRRRDRSRCGSVTIGQCGDLPAQILNRGQQATGIVILELLGVRDKISPARDIAIAVVVLDEGVVDVRIGRPGPVDLLEYDFLSIWAKNRRDRIGTISYIRLSRVYCGFRSLGRLDG